MNFAAASITSIPTSCFSPRSALAANTDADDGMSEMSSSRRVSVGSVAGAGPPAGVGGTSDAHGLCGDGDGGGGVNANVLRFSTGGGGGGVGASSELTLMESSFRSSVASRDSIDSATRPG